MSDEEDFDEFPSITVNSSIHESSSFSMPSAEELATQRAREEACEQEILRLRAEDQHHTQSSEIMVSMLAHSDSSSSEGEAALAAAVGVLRVQPASCPAGGPLPLPHPSPCPSLAGSLRVLRARLPPPAAAAQHLFDAHIAALETATEPQAIALTVQIAEGISTLVAEASDSGDAWESEEAVGAATWLCAALACPLPLPLPLPPGTRRTLRRTLHLLLEEVVTDEQMSQLSWTVGGAALDSAAALELSDALRGGGGRADTLADTVVRAALARLAGAGQPHETGLSALAGGLVACWRRLAPARQYVALQLLARLLPPPGDPPPPPPGGQGGQGGEERRLLAALLHATAHKEKTTDTLKVLVAASKLQVLFNLHAAAPPPAQPPPPPPPPAQAAHGNT